MICIFISRYFPLLNRFSLSIESTMRFSQYLGRIYLGKSCQSRAIAKPPSWLLPPKERCSNAPSCQKTPCCRAHPRKGRHPGKKGCRRFSNFAELPLQGTVQPQEWLKYDTSGISQRFRTVRFSFGYRFRTIQTLGAVSEASESPWHRFRRKQDRKLRQKKRSNVNQSWPSLEKMPLAGPANTDLSIVVVCTCNKPPIGSSTILASLSEF